MRVFVAVACPPAVAVALDSVAACLRDTRWRVVAPEARHLTLRFLGEQPPDAVGAVVAALSAVRDTAPFSLELRGVGTFPDPRRPEVVWVGCAAGTERLGALAAGLERALAGAGFPREDRPFRAHLTLARRRPRADAAAAAGDVAAARARAGQGPLGRFPVRAVTLFRSELGPAGPRYTVLAEAALAPQAPA